MEHLLNEWWFAYLVLPLLIFAARILDVSLGTIRILFIAKGYQTRSALLGFFEVFIWLLVISSIMKNLNSPFYYIFYAAGFAAGNYVGIALERKLRIGKVALRIITRESSKELLAYFQSRNLGYSVVDAEGSQGPVKILYSIIDRKSLETLLPKLNDLSPRAFYSIEDVKTASANFSSHEPVKKPLRKRLGRFVPVRKGK